ncbi:magnesium/cobalt transporter CorA [Cetobacterium sp.]|uniref:magnesium/cobalt transporter CorA n=1 Tax=Cetobacterium sp. TaxID=2071632 RepID=UPI003F363F40
MNSKIGLQPGSLIYTGNYKPQDIIAVEQFSYNEDKVNIETSNLKQDLNLKLLPELNNWLNISGIHNVEMIKNIGEFFKIDSLILEDILSNDQRPKIEVRDNLVFINLKLISPESNDIFKYEQISLLLFDNLLITFQESPNSIFDKIKNRIEKNIGRLRKKNTSYLTYGLLDRIIDNYFLILDSLNSRLDELEEEIITNPTKESFEKILTLKKDILKLRKCVYPLKELISNLKSNEVKEFFGEDVGIFLVDLEDHITIVYDTVENLFIKGNELIQLYHTTISTGMNEIMKVLTMISTIFIPLSFLVGLYGMNFETMPELQWKYGYFLLLGVLFSIVGSMAYFFKKKKWW